MKSGIRNEKGQFVKGHSITEEIRKKMKEKRKLQIITDKTREKMRKARMGKPSYVLGKHWKLSEKTKRRIGKAKKGIPTGRIPWNKNKKCPQISERQKGEKNHQWRGGISFEPYSTDWTETLKRAIRERDHYICRLCLNYGNAVHHIDYDKNNCNLNNLITLCKRCNGKVNFNRNYWKNYFKGRI